MNSNFETSSQRIAKKELSQLEAEDFENVMRPVGRAIYDQKEDVNKHKKADPRDRVICDICGGEFTRWNRSKHNVTKIHKAYLNMNNKLKKALLGK